MTDSKILDIPSEVISINDATKSVLLTSGKAMCERLAGNAEFARQVYLKTGDMKALHVWAGYARQADSALLTYKSWLLQTNHDTCKK